MSDILDRDQAACVYCGLEVGMREEGPHAVLDHVVPRCDGGPTIVRNLVLSCVRCNSRKGGRRLANELEILEDIERRSREWNLDPDGPIWSDERYEDFVKAGERRYYRLEERKRKARELLGIPEPI